MIHLTTREVRKRKKRRCFYEFTEEREQGLYRSEQFYAESWSVSKSTAHAWIKDFREELEKLEILETERTYQ